MAGHVCVVGSANLDLVALTARLPRSGETVTGHAYIEAPGGKGLNQAVAAARAGARVTFVGAVGDDDAGRTLRRIAETDEIDVAHLTTIADMATGRALIGVSDDGANFIIVVPGANDLVSIEVVSRASDAIASADILLVQQEVPDEAILAALTIARNAGVTTILNPAPARGDRRRLLEFVDIVVPNEHELAALGDTSAIPVVIVTEGAHGARLLTREGERRVSAFTVDAIDSVAAGDAFCGTLAASLAIGHDLDVSLRRASAAGALATLTRGAVPSLPTNKQVDELIARAR